MWDDARITNDPRVRVRPGTTKISPSEPVCACTLVLKVAHP